MKRDESGRPVGTEDEPKQGDQVKQSFKNPAEESKSPTAPRQTPEKTNQGQKGRNPEREDDETSDGSPAKEG